MLIVITIAISALLLIDVSALDVVSVDIVSVDTTTAIASGRRAGQSEPAPPIWPDRFHASLIQNRSGALASVDLWYDWKRGYNLNLIQKQLGSTLWDLEWSNHTSFYFDKQAQTCKVIKFPVGILTPDWLKEAHYGGTEVVDGFLCNRWEKADFVTYWTDAKSGVPVKWIFLWDGAVFHVMSFLPGKTLPAEDLQAPSYCFNGTDLASQ